MNRTHGILPAFALIAGFWFAACSKDAANSVDPGTTGTPEGGTNASDASVEANATGDGASSDASSQDGMTAEGGDSGNGDDGGEPIDGGASTTMSFFVTSSGTGASGGDLGGLAGADARCQALVQASALVPPSVKAKTWRAYLSTSTVDARDRIGAGPWYDFGGSSIAGDLAELHTTGLLSTHMLTELGTTVPDNDHDVLTGSQADGTVSAATCLDWTGSSVDDYGQVGHANWSSPGTIGNPSWNASHEARCDQAGLLMTAGTGRTYCFAID